jgi:hypothetical protein
MNAENSRISNIAREIAMEDWIPPASLFYAALAALLMMAFHPLRSLPT